MTIAEKLRFLADRLEDEKEFYISDYLYTYQSGQLMTVLYEIEKDYKFFKSDMTLDSILWLDLKLKPQWEFTEDEKAILRNLPTYFNWITRNDDGDLCVFKNKPEKEFIEWVIGTSKNQDYEHYKYADDADLWIYEHLFQCIQWSDDEPCEFRKYL